MLKTLSLIGRRVLSKKCDVHRGNDQQQFILEFTDTCFVRSVHQGEQANTNSRGEFRMAEVNKIDRPEQASAA